VADTNTNQNKPASVKSGKSKTAVWGGVAFLLFVIAGLVFGGLKANQYLQDEQQMPVQVIDFSGDYQHIDITKRRSLEAFSRLTSTKYLSLLKRSPGFIARQ